MLNILAWVVALVVLSWLWLRFCARCRREWDDYQAAERVWMARVERGEFAGDAKAMNAAHPRQR